MFPFRNVLTSVKCWIEIQFCDFVIEFPFSKLSGSPQSHLSQQLLPGSECHSDSTIQGTAHAFWDLDQ